MPLPDDLSLVPAGEAPVKRGRGRPKKGEVVEKPEKETKAPDAFSQNGASVRSGVTVNWLSEALGMDKRTVNRRVAHIRPIREEGKSKYYDFREVMSLFVIQADGDAIRTFLENARTADIPAHLAVGFWIAQEKKLDIAERAKDLFKGEGVRDLIARMAHLGTDSLKGQAAFIAKKSHTDMKKTIDGISDAFINSYKTGVVQAVKLFEDELSVLDDLAEEEEYSVAKSNGAKKTNGSGKAEEIDVSEISQDDD